MSAAEFDEANRLWFFKGRTFAALDLYRQLTKLNPEDPVILFQAARALWSFDYLDEARSAIDRAAALKAALSDDGYFLVEFWRKRFASPPGPRPDVPLGRLDMDQLDPAMLSASEWLVIADAAIQREIHGLAVIAVEHGKDALFELDIVDDVRRKLSINYGALSTMTAGSNT